jgi:hypothetical protein
MSPFKRGWNCPSPLHWRPWAQNPSLLLLLLLNGLATDGLAMNGLATMETAFFGTRFFSTSFAFFRIFCR